MEQIYDNLAVLMQATAAYQTNNAWSAQSKPAEQTSDFQKLLEQRAEETQTPEQTPVKAEEKPAEPTKTEPESDAPAEKPQDTEEPEAETEIPVEVLQSQMLPLNIVTVEAPVEEAPAAVVAEVNAAPVQAAVEQPVQTTEAQAPVQQEAAQTAQTVDAPDVSQGTEQNQAQVQAQPAQTAEAAAPQQQPQTETRQDGGELQMEQAPTGKAENGEVVQEAAAGETAVFQNVETEPIKVSDVAQPAETTRTEQPVMQQVTDQLAQAVQNGVNRVEIQLQPANLGKVSVEVTWDENAAVHIVLHAESSETQNLLEKNLVNLQSLLSRDEQQDIQVEVPRQEESQWHNPRDNQQQQEQQQNQQEQQQERHKGSYSEQDFLQQLRLGLIPMGTEAS